jgi:AraC-like DNA-binding protein
LGEIRHEFLQKHINNINIEIIEHAHYYGDKNSWCYYDMCSPYNRLYFTLAGDAYIQSNKEKVDLIPGNIYLIPMYSHYNFMCKSNMEQFYIHFRVNVFNGLDLFSDVNICMSQPMDISQQLKFTNICKGDKLQDVFKIKSSLYEIIAGYLENMQSFSQKYLENAFKYMALNQFIQNSCRFSLTQKDVANYVGISESLLIKNFKSDTGITLKNHMYNFILQSAKEKLIITDLSIKEIAYELDFSDEFYFSKFFKKNTELSPREYRKLNKIKA